MVDKVIRMESDVALQDLPQKRHDDPLEQVHTYFSSEDGRLHAGVWGSTASNVEIEAYPTDEFCYVISGSVIITNHEDNSQDEFKAGDAFFIPKGTAMTWHVPKSIRKYYVIRE